MKKLIEGCLGRSETGLSLVELTIAMGVASVMTLAIGEAIRLSQRSQKSMMASQEYDLAVQNTRVTLSREAVCTTLFNQPHLQWHRRAAAPGNYITDSTAAAPAENRIYKLQLSSSQIIFGASPGPAPYRGIQMDPLELKPLSPPIVATQSYGGVSGQYETNLVQIKFGGQRQGGTDGTVAIGGASLQPVSVTLSIVTGPLDGSSPTPNKIVSCYADQQGPEAACNSLGGTWRAVPPSGQTQCLIATADFFDGGYGERSAPGQADLLGSRIRLWPGAAANNRKDDTAVGVGTDSLWFNLGGTGSGMFRPDGAATPPNHFLWNSRPQTLNAADLAAGRSTGAMLMSLAADGALTLAPDDSRDATLAFGSGGPGNAPREYIRSVRSGAGADRGSLAFWTGKTDGTAGSNARLRLWKGGRVQLGKSEFQDGVGPAADSYSELIFSDGNDGASAQPLVPGIRAFVGLAKNRNRYNELQFFAGDRINGNTPHLALQGGYINGGVPVAPTVRTLAGVDFIAGENLAVSKNAKIDGVVTIPLLADSTRAKQVIVSTTGEIQSIDFPQANECFVRRASAGNGSIQAWPAWPTVGNAAPDSVYSVSQVCNGIGEVAVGGDCRVEAYTATGWSHELTILGQTIDTDKKTYTCRVGTATVGRPGLKRISVDAVCCRF